MATDRKPLKINRDILRVLNDALAHCNMNDCGVDAPKDSSDAPGTCGIRKEHREAMRTYIETWIAAPLSLAIAAIEGEARGERHVRAMRDLPQSEPAAFLRRFE